MRRCAPATYLEVTYRGGRPIAAYLQLPHSPDSKVDHSLPILPGIVVDFSADRTPLGVEFLNPAETDRGTILAKLAEIGANGVKADDLAPLWPAPRAPVRDAVAPRRPA